MRIVSLVPSQTELLFDLGLDTEVVGITKFCIHPENWRHTKNIVGGTKNVNLDVVDKLKPDLIIANKEENTKEDVEALMKKYKVYVSDVFDVESAYGMMKEIGKLVNKEREASELILSIKQSFSFLEGFQESFKIKKALYLIWRKPWMTVGTDTFISEMMRVAGFEIVIKEKRYPTLKEEQIRSFKDHVEVVLLSSEPYPFKEEQIDELKRMLPAAKVVLVDGEMFSWYGSRMGMMASYFKELRATLF